MSFHVFLQVWGGLFYLLNKVFFSRSERVNNKETKRKWRIASWSIYLLGLPAWVIIFIHERNWMVAFVETGGAISMMLGLIIAIRGIGKEPKWINGIALVFAFVGIGYSLYDFGGINTINQLLELGIVSGFLIGTYLLAKESASGYIWFVVMIVSNCSLMFIQDYPWLAIQQIVSLFFVIDAFLSHRRKKKMHTLNSTE